MPAAPRPDRLRDDDSDADGRSSDDEASSSREGGRVCGGYPVIILGTAVAILSLAAMGWELRPGGSKSVEEDSSAAGTTAKPSLALAALGHHVASTQPPSGPASALRGEKERQSLEAQEAEGGGSPPTVARKSVPAPVPPEAGEMNQPQVAPESEGIHRNEGELFAPRIIYHETGGPPGMDPPKNESMIAEEKPPLALAGFGSAVISPRKSDSDDMSSTDANRTSERTSGTHHYALPCWDQCGGKPGACDWCGVGYACCRYGYTADVDDCQGVSWWPVLTFHTCVWTDALAATAEGLNQQPQAPLPPAPSHRFYVYRAQNYEEWPFGNINVGNLQGTMWYLANEVMPRCPKRYNITRLKRILINTQATPELFAKGMNFAVRYSYDAGKCTGSNTRPLGPCSRTWDRFGYVPGCNNFRDHYPWPIVTTTYPEGIWYDLPIEGLCASPTGAQNCTWSYQEAGEILIEEELEQKTPGGGYCCHGRCTSFWNHRFSYSECSNRVQRIMDLFKEKYPDKPRDLPPPPCDFDRWRFWS